MPTDKTQTTIDSLGKAFSEAIAKVWEGDAADTIIDPSARHEACHVARFVFGVPEPMVAAVKGIPGVTSVAVEGMFCHAQPFAFWDRPESAGGVERREMADLMVEVEIESDGRTFSRAVLIQAKMQDEKEWAMPTKIAASVLKQQRELYTFLPKFGLELPTRPNADALRTAKCRVSGHTGLDLYDLKGLAEKNPGGLVYAAIKQSDVRSGQRSPWLVEDGRPPQPAKTSNAIVTDGIFSLDFGVALASMIAEGRPGKFPPIGVRSDGCLDVPNDWKRLIDDLKAFARHRLTEDLWSDHKSDLTKKKAYNIVIVPKSGVSNSQALLNRATFTIADNKILTFNKSVRTPRWIPNASAWKSSFDTIRNAEWLANAQGTGNPEDLRRLELRIPEDGFGFLNIRIAVANSRR